MLKRVTAIILCALVLTSAIGCGTAQQPADVLMQNQTSEAAGATSEAAETKVSYSYPDKDYGGSDFVILNIEPIWDFYTYFDFENMTGDPIDDAIYNRNRAVEKQFNIKLHETDIHMDKIVAALQKVILAGDTAYDVSYIPGNLINPLITEKQLADLMDMPDLKLDQPWWDQTVVADSILNNTLYFALCDITLEGLQGAWVLYFNDDMMESLGLDKPYDLVRSGTWTYDRLAEYMKAGVNLNGDESFAFKDDGSCVYGMTSYEAGTAAMIIGSGERYIKLDSGGTPYLALDNDRFYSVAQKIADILNTEGEYFSANDARPSLKAYDLIFQNERALFLGAEIKATLISREMEDNFGIVPYPKYEEAQTGYSASLYQQLPLLCVPVTNPDYEKTGIILDALAYQSYTDTMPVFYNTTVSQKGLRNEDSVEMLGIIRESRFFDIGLAYGWTNDLWEKVRVKINGGSADVASIIAKESEKVAAKITKTMEKLG
ncbi:MAG: hypothetical protein WCQ72_03200 [Eubacteriales bacterium]